MQTVYDWLHAQLLAHGYRLNGEVTMTHERAWSQVATVPTTQGTLYLKMTKPALRFEVGLTEALYRWGMPVPEVVAAEPEQGWLLLLDAGDIGRWQTAVSHYAQRQIALIGVVSALSRLSSCLTVSIGQGEPARWIG